MHDTVRNKSVSGCRVAYSKEKVEVFDVKFGVGLGISDPDVFPSRMRVFHHILVILQFV